MALQRALSARDDRPVLLSKFLPERGIVHAHRITDCGHRIGCKATIRIQVETEGVDTRSGRLGEPSSPCDPILEPFLFQHAQRLSEREEERDRRREWGVLLREGVGVGLQVRVERRVGVQ